MAHCADVGSFGNLSRANQRRKKNLREGIRDRVQVQSSHTAITVKVLNNAPLYKRSEHAGPLKSLDSLVASG